MEFLGIGPTELALIILIALIVIGPKDLEKTAKTVGRWLNNLVRSEEWQALRRTSKEISNLPTKLMREANLEDELKDLGKEVNKIGQDIQKTTSDSGFGTWSNPAAAKPKPPQTIPTPATNPENKSVPPEQTPPPAQETNPETNKEPDNNA